MIASEKGNLALVEAITSEDPQLLAYNQKDMEDKTEIFHAIQGGQENVDVVTLLLNTGSQFVGLYEDKGFTPFLLAVKLGKLAIVEQLLKMQANPNEQTKQEGNSALHLAAQFGFIDIFALLIEYDADLTLLNKKKETPRDVAQRKKDSVILKFIDELQEQKEDQASKV